MDLIGSLEFGQHTEVQSCFLLGGVSDQTLRPAEFPGQPTTSYAVPGWKLGGVVRVLICLV